MSYMENQMQDLIEAGLEMQREEWEEKQSTYFIGRKVKCYKRKSTDGKLMDAIETKISETPWRLFAGCWVCKVEGFAGCVSLDYLELF